MTKLEAAANANSEGRDLDTNDQRMMAIGFKQGARWLAGELRKQSWETHNEDGYSGDGEVVWVSDIDALLGEGE